MRKIFDFHGGIHPPENKHQSLRTGIADAGIPPELVLPLSQHIGAPATPVVEIGERVLKGQMIAEAVGFYYHSIQGMIVTGLPKVSTYWRPKLSSLAR